MKPVSRAICQALLEHHRHTCKPRAFIKSCVIAYGELCERAGIPEMTLSVGDLLYEVAEWCRDKGLPPLNAIAVNAETGHPGDKYDVAPGCSLLNWENEAQACIDCTGYPEEVE